MILLNSVVFPAIYCSLINQLYLAVLVENMQEHWTEKEKYTLRKLLAGITPHAPQILIIFIKNLLAAKTARTAHTSSLSGPTLVMVRR